jgi:hypothetical protein
MPRDPRYRLREPLSLTFLAGSSRGVGRIEDLSRTGIFVRSAMLPESGVRVETLLKTASGQLIAVAGVVQWNTASVASKRRQSGFGLRVTAHGAEYLGLVEGVVAAGERIPDLVLGT